MTNVLRFSLEDISWRESQSRIELVERAEGTHVRYEDYAMLEREIDSRQQSIDMLLDMCKLLLEAIRDSYEEGYYTAANCNTDAARYSDDVQAALTKANEIMEKVRSK